MKRFSLNSWIFFSQMSKGLKIVMLAIMFFSVLFVLPNLEKRLWAVNRIAWSININIDNDSNF